MKRQLVILFVLFFMGHGLKIIMAQTIPQDTTADLRSYSQYDFVPGDKILFYEDFNQDTIGEFSALWTTSQ